MANRKRNSESVFAGAAAGWCAGEFGTGIQNNRALQADSHQADICSSFRGLSVGLIFQCRSWLWADPAAALLMTSHH